MGWITYCEKQVTSTDIGTMNTYLNKTMDDLYFVSHVAMRVVHNHDGEHRGDASRRKLFSINARDSFYGGRYETFALHANATDESVIKYVDVQSLYPCTCTRQNTTHWVTLDA